MAEQHTTSPHPVAVEAPQEAETRPERNRLRFLAPLVGAVTLFAASGSSERIVAQEDHSHGNEAPVAMIAPSPVSFEDSGLTYPQSELEQLANGARNVAVLERAYSNRPDIPGRQVQAVYVVPAGGKDNGYDKNGILDINLNNADDWGAGDGRGEGSSIRWDVYKDEDGQTKRDNGFMESPSTGEQLFAKGSGIISVFKDQLAAKGYLVSPTKSIIVFYEGDMNYGGACAFAKRPSSENPGEIAVISLAERCGPINSTDRRKYNSLDYSTYHEFFHTLGATPDSASTYDGSGHSTDPRDLMYGKATSPSALFNPNNDNYDYKSWMTPSQEGVNVFIYGPGAVSSNLQPNRYIGIGEPIVTESGTMYYRKGDKVTFDALTLGEDSEFVGWGGACTGDDKCDITVNGEKTLLANYVETTDFNITVKGPGVVKFSGEQACSSAGVTIKKCHYDVPIGNRVLLKAKPTANSRFLRWTLPISTDPAQSVRAIKDKDINKTAIFTKIPTKRKVKGKN